MTNNINTLVKNAVYSAVLDSNDGARQNAEQYLLDYRSQNANEYFVVLGQNIASDEYNSDLKIAHFTIMAKSLKEQCQEKNYYEWMPDNMKKNIEQLGLEFLISDDHRVLRAAASFVAEIFVLRKNMPNNKWLDLLNILTNNIMTDDFKIRKASILTIAFICELVGKDDRGLELDEIEKMLQCICVVLGNTSNQSQEEIDLRTEGLKAFNYASATFCHLMCERDNVRDFTMNKILENCVMMCCNKMGDWIPMMAWQCFTEVARLMYDKLAGYFSVLAEKSFEVLKNPSIDEHIKIAVTEFWSAIADEEIYRKVNIQLEPNSNNPKKAYNRQNHNFIAKNHTQLLINLCPNLKSVEEYEIVQQNNNTLFSSTASCLYSVIELITDKAQKIITDFVSAYIGNYNNWQEQVACLKAFQYLIMNCSRSVAGDLLDKTIVNTMSLFDSENNQVKYAVEQFLFNCAERHYMIMGQTEFSGNFYNKILGRLNNGEPEDVEYMAKLIEYLSGGSNHTDIQRPIIKTRLNDTIQSLVSAITSDNLDSQSISPINACFSALLAIMPHYYSPDENFANIQKFMDISSNLSNKIDSETRKVIKNNIYMVIVFILGNLWKTQKDIQFAESKLEKMTQKLFEPLIFHITENFQRENYVFEDGVVIFGYLAQIMEGRFRKYFDNIWPSITENLSNLNTSEVGLMKASFEATVNFSMVGL